MVRRRLEIKKIENKAKRQTTFTKRRQGLFKKAEELGKKCDVYVAVITFSNAGNLYATGNPSVAAVINRYLRNESFIDGEKNETNEDDKNDSPLVPLSTEKNFNNEVEQILEEIEEIKSKISLLPVEDSKLHGLDKSLAELEDMKGTLEEIKAENYKPKQG